MAARFEIIHEVPAKLPLTHSWRLHFQYGTYHYDNGDPSEDGFRFIWRRPNGSLQAARGQARIPCEKDLRDLLDLATAAGWYKP